MRFRLIPNSNSNSTTQFRDCVAGQSSLLFSTVASTGYSKCLIRLHTPLLPSRLGIRSEFLTEVSPEVMFSRSASHSCQLMEMSIATWPLSRTLSESLRLLFPMMATSFFQAGNRARESTFGKSTPPHCLPHLELAGKG